jgi:hypothetical protein
LARNSWVKVRIHIGRLRPSRSALVKSLS